MTTTDPLTTQVGGSHYKNLPIQPVMFSTANRYDACAHSILKYTTRWRSKNGIQDLEKAIHFARIRQTPDIEQYLPEPWYVASTRSPRIQVHEYIEKNGIPVAEAAILEWLDNWVAKGDPVAGQMVAEGLINLIAQQEGSKNG